MLSGPLPPDTSSVSTGSGSAVIAQVGTKAKPHEVGTGSAVGATVAMSYRFCLRRRFAMSNTCSGPVTSNGVTPA
jgi:hypothetical protein